MSLKIENLTVYYQTLRGDVQALESTTFTVADGEIMGLAGESGCGKSTLGNSLIFLKPPDEAHEGQCDPRRRRLADPGYGKDERFPLQEDFHHPAVCHECHESDAQDRKDDGRTSSIEKCGLQATLPELKRRLDLVKLSDDVLNMYPIELSGGMKQRMVMVLSTLLNPSLLIADEITSALDVSTQKAVAKMLVGFRNAGIL